MTTLIQRPACFQGFGPSIVTHRARGRLCGSLIPDRRLAARKMLREKCPSSPGVYGWLDARRQLIYVGKSKSLRTRLLSYFAKSPADKKMDRIRQHSRHLVWEPIPHELLALIREQELIYRWRPELNSQGQPTRRQPAFLSISNTPAPHVLFTRRLSPRTSTAYGPIAGTAQLQHAAASLNQVFSLRDCADKTRFEFNDQLQLFGQTKTAKCIRYELGSCPGPCAGNCSAAAYQKNVDRAVAFLDGRDTSILSRLESNMQTAAQSQSYERAAILRDQWENLSWLHRRLRDLRSSQSKLNGVLPISAGRWPTIWLMLRGGSLVLSAAQPIRARSGRVAVKKIRQIAARSIDLPTDWLGMNLQLIVSGWFRKYPELISELIEFEAAIEKCSAIAVESPRTIRQPAVLKKSA